MPIGVLSSYLYFINCKINQNFDKLYLQALFFIRKACRYHIATYNPTIRNLEIYYP